MISLETAKKLKDVGLKWGPQQGDLFYSNYMGGQEWNKRLLSYADIVIYRDNPKYLKNDWIFAPRLDQLLAEVEGRGHWCAIMPTNAVGVDVSYFTELYRLGELSGHLEAVWRKEADGFLISEFKADSPEEAVAAALLWILESEEAKG